MLWKILEDLGRTADEGRLQAQYELTDLARETGLTYEDVEAMGSWGDVAKAVQERQPASLRRKESAPDIIRVLRVLEYIGPRFTIEEYVRKSIQGERRFEQDGGTVIIRAATVGDYPEVLKDGGTVFDYPGAPADIFVRLEKLEILEDALDKIHNLRGTVDRVDEGTFANDIAGQALADARNWTPERQTALDALREGKSNDA